MDAYDGLEPSDLGVALSSDSNNSCRSFVSKSGGFIKLGGGGVGFGHTTGLARCPVLAQPEHVASKISNHAGFSALCIGLFLLELLGGLRFSGRVFALDPKRFGSRVSALLLPTGSLVGES